jgi:hypothetical protein
MQRRLSRVAAILAKKLRRSGKTAMPGAPYQ